MRQLPRKQAIISHFLLSLTIVLSLLAVIFFVWYPSPYFEINGAGNVLRTLIGVDLVLGPVLTAILYKPGKKSLWFDMSFVAVVQLSALIYGATVLYQQRPEFMVFAVDRFVLVPRVNLYPSDEGVDEMCDLRWQGPCMVAAVMPDDPKQREALMMLSLEQRVELEQQAKYWRPLPDETALVLRKARPLAVLADANEEADAAVESFVRRKGGAIADYKFLPVMNPRGQATTLILDAQTAKFTGVLSFDPWDELERDDQ
ncbi:MAG: TfpX/TfpZ family type IV pilin accessory protein [Pseudomonadota bacterium]